jgi:hypothetical protein
MQRQSLTVDELVQNIQNSWMPVYSAFAESNQGVLLRTLEVDLICEWRLPDGKVRFVKVKFETEAEFQTLVESLKKGADNLHQEIHQRISKLRFADTEKE